MQEKEKRYWLYAIKSESSGRIYLGQAVDLEDRIRRHNSGEVYSTKADRPWRLIGSQSFESRSQAFWKEGELKRSRGKRLKWLEMNRD